MDKYACYYPPNRYLSQLATICLDILCHSKSDFNNINARPEYTMILILIHFKDNQKQNENSYWWTIMKGDPTRDVRISSFA